EGALTLRIEQQGNMLLIEVGDDGAGLDLEQMREAALRRALVAPEELASMSTQQLHQLIFRPGFSTRMEATEFSGRGVGLDVVRNQIQTLQGHVEVQSVAGQGARFVLTLPADLGSSRELVIRPLPADVRELPAYQGAATLARGELVLILRPDFLVSSEHRAEAGLAGTRRALVVDDSLTARALHRTALETGGYLVHTASNGRQALEQLRHSAYDVMVCDIGMDEMDGYELTAAVP